MKRDEIAAHALSCVGKSRDEVGCSGSHAWCANFVSYVFKRVGINMYDLSCTSMRNRMAASSEWDEPETKPEIGDPIFFEWDGDEGGDCDHVGIVVDVSGNTITYVNGNGSSSTHVTKQQININSRYIAYWMRYVSQTSSDARESTCSTSSDKTFACEIRQLKSGSVGASVKSLQQLLSAKGYSVGDCGADGDFGKDTEAAVIKFQIDNKLDSDGIVGPKTFEKLWGCR